MSKECIAKVRDLGVSYGNKQVLVGVSFTLYAGDCLAIVGPMGSGKTTLAKALSGRLFRTGEVFFTGQVLYVAQQHHFKNRSNLAEFYMQQRFNASDSADAYTMREELAGLDVQDWPSIFQLDGLWDKPLLQFSNGENKRLQLVKAMASQADWLIVDNPFLGLDQAGRAILEQGFRVLLATGRQIILICSPSTLPSFVTRVYPLAEQAQERSVDLDALRSLLRPIPPFNDAVVMQDVQIRYGERTILSKLHWTVKRGERWLLKGPNGAGKSTVLSLITADNPQAYSQQITLFDRKRGSGESIWDIKRMIGFVSPELHVYMKQAGTARAVVGSGLFDTLGVARTLAPDQIQRVQAWMELLGILNIQDRPFMQLSVGEQRMTLIARALVKHPALLILDEPCQGLDAAETQRVSRILDALCAQSEMTLIYVSHVDADIPRCVTLVKELSIHP